MDKLISQNDTMEGLSDLIFDKDNDKYFDGVVDAMGVVAIMPGVPQWIPCENEMQIDCSDDLLLCCETGGVYKYKYICVGFHLDRFEREADEDDDEDYVEYNEEDGKMYCFDGWYERVHGWCDIDSAYINDKVVAYMPLPKEYRSQNVEDE